MGSDFNLEKRQRVKCMDQLRPREEIRDLGGLKS